MIKTKYNHTVSKTSRSGMVLLLIILLTITLLTVGLSTIKLTSEETKIAKLEADSKKAFAAAEAGIEASLQQQGAANLDTFFDTSSGVSVSTQYQPSQSSNIFTTPLLMKDEQYTFYLTDYTPIAPIDPDNPNSTQIFGTAYPLALKIRLKNPTDYCNLGGGVNKFAVELTFLHIDDGIVGRKLIDECDPPIVITNPTYDYLNKITFDENLSLNNAQLMLLRIIAPNPSFDGVVLEIEKTSGGVWPPQGKEVISTATTSTDVSKKVRVIQSYPQLHTDFWITSF